MAAVGAMKKTEAGLVDTSCSDCCLDQVRCSKALRNIFYLGPHMLAGAGMMLIGADHVFQHSSVTQCSGMSLDLSVWCQG